MHIHDFYPSRSIHYSKDKMLCLMSLEYLYNDLENDKHGGYAHACGCDVRDVKKDVYELLKHYTYPNSEVLLKAFDENFNTSEEWGLFYETVNVLFNQWFIKNH